MSKLTYAYAFACLTLYKRDISELIHLFQTHLEQVEITMDGLPIADTTQLDQFDPTYQAVSLTARGHSRRADGKENTDHNERLSVELRINKLRAVLQIHGWRNRSMAEPEVSTRIRKVLLRCQNRVQHLLQVIAIYLILFTPFSVQPTLQEHRVAPLLQIFLIFGCTLLLVPPTFFFFNFIVKLFHLEKQIFLFPGALRTTHVYGGREAVGRLITALCITIIFDLIIIILLRLLWK